MNQSDTCRGLLFFCYTSVSFPGPNRLLVCLGLAIHQLWTKSPNAMTATYIPVRTLCRNAIFVYAKHSNASDQ